MPTFNVKNGTDTYTLDTMGLVKKGEAAWGSWTVAPDCNISLIPSAGKAVPIPTTWSFLNNQLQATCGAEIHDFYALNPAIQVDVDSANGYLKVSPSGRTAGFSFSIVGQWSFSANYNLEYTPSGGQASPLIGKVSDRKSRFAYQFDAGSETLQLVFSGQWDLKKANGKVHATFTYSWKDPGSGDVSDKVFELPNAAIGVDATTNLLKITYADKKWEVLLLGRAKIANGVFISYEVVDSSGNLTTTLSINADLKGKVTGKTVEFSLTDDAGKISTSFKFTSKWSIDRASGELSFVVTHKSGAKRFGEFGMTLRANFTTTTGNDRIFLEVTYSGKTFQVSLEVSSEIKFRNGPPVDIWWKVTYTDNGSQRGISMILGFSI